MLVDDEIYQGSLQTGLRNSVYSILGSTTGRASATRISALPFQYFFLTNDKIARDTGLGRRRRRARGEPAGNYGGSVTAAIGMDTFTHESSIHLCVAPSLNKNKNV